MWFTPDMAPRDDMAADRPVDPRVAHTRRLVLEAAASLLAEEGFDRLTLEELAERSGVARSTIYRNWDDRSELFADAFDLLCSFPEIPDLGSMRDELEFLARELAASLESSEWAKALPSLIGAAHHDDVLGSAQARFSEGRRELTSAIFRRADDRGELGAAHDPHELAELFAAPLFFRFLMSHQPLDEAFLRRHVDRLVTLAAP